MSKTLPSVSSSVSPSSSPKDENGTRANSLLVNESKLPYHPEARERIEKLFRNERVAPITVDMALTTGCTYKCVYCYAQKCQRQVGYIPTPVVKETFRTFARIGVRAVSLVSDGESTCHVDCNDLIVFGKNRGLDMALGTNGATFDPTPEVLGALTYIRFNVSAASPDEYCKIHGVRSIYYYHVIKVIRKTVKIRDENKLPLIIGLQCVLWGENPEIIDLVDLADSLGVDYIIFKHCSDDEFGTIGVDHDNFKRWFDDLALVDSWKNSRLKIYVKWSKLQAGNKRSYDQCWGPSLHLQLSGSGLVAPCGMLFNERYAKDFWIGNLNNMSFGLLFESDRYWEVMRRLRSPCFNPKTDCGCLCLQDATNRWLYKVASKKESLSLPQEPPPLHHNFL